MLGSRFALPIFRTSGTWAKASISGRVAAQACMTSAQNSSGTFSADSSVALGHSVDQLLELSRGRGTLSPHVSFLGLCQAELQAFFQ